MNSWVHRSLRRARSDDGFSVVEIVIALSLLAIVIVGVGQIASSALLHGLRNRERETAVAISNRAIEEVRSNGYENVAMVDGPASYTDSDGTYTTLQDAACTTCLTHSQPVSEDGFDFTLETYVIGIDDPDDGSGTSDADGLTVDYKRVVVQVSSPTDAGFTYTVETIVHDTTSEEDVVVQGVSIEIHDPEGQLVADDGEWELDIAGAGITDAVVTEGLYSNFAMAAGTYTCTLSNTDSSESWYPSGNESATSETFQCSVTAESVTTIIRTWETADDCPAISGIRSDLWIKVVDNTGADLTGASVDPAPADLQPENPAPASTLNGEVIFPGALIGDYTLAVSKAGYVTQTGLNVCLTATEATEPHLVVTLIANAPPESAEVHVTFMSKKKGTKNWKLVLEDGPQYYEQQLSVSKNQTATFIIVPVEYGEYDIVLYCQKKEDQDKWNKRKENKDETFSVPSPPYTYDFGDVNC